MNGPASDLDGRIAKVAADRESGASDLLDEAIGILRDARALGQLDPVARRLCRAQPSMASIWNAAAAALGADIEERRSGVPEDRASDRFEQFVQRLARARQALARFASDCLAMDGSDGPLHLVTISMSRSVLTVVEAVRQRRPVRVACSESRPALEGRTLASHLAATGVPVAVYGDAAIAHALAGASAVVLGADAISARGFLNKTGSSMLAAAASQQGVPVYVAATRDKFAGATLSTRLTVREGDPREVWDSPPPGIDVRNPYFELTPLDGVSAVISDLGVLGIGMVPDVCEAAADPAAVQRLLDLVSA